MKKILIILSFILLATGGYFIYSTHRATAADLSRFQAGRIIDDSIFTDNQSMTASQIQDFLNQKNSTCLMNFRSLSLHDDNGDGIVQDSTTEQYGPGTMSAAELIAAAATIYRISPKVILVTLEKEQGLVTRTDCPSWRYNTALGYGCPDTAPCDQSAYGFTRQIDYGTYHFRGFFDDSLPSVPYGTGDNTIYYNPGPYNTSTNSYYGRFGTSPDIQYCGSSTVYIQNHATAALYNYTPYQPNAASLAAGYGSAEPCGAYGNRNFFQYFTDWFGNTIGPEYGFVDAVNPPSVILPNDVVNSKIRIRNLSGKTWYSDGNTPVGEHPFRLAITSYQNTPFGNPTDPAWMGTSNQIKMKEASVANGDIATFEFTFKGPLRQVDNYFTAFTPVYDGANFLPYIGLSFTTSTPKPIFSYQVTSSSGFSQNMPQNFTQHASYSIQNTGNIVWWGELNRMVGASAVRLVTTSPYYHVSPFYDSSTWLASNQIKLSADRIDPGSYGNFNFDIKSPDSRGVYAENFGLVLDGAALYPVDSQMQFKTNVTDYSYSLISSNIPEALIAGQRYDCTVVIKNTGVASWYADGNVPQGSSPIRLITSGYRAHSLYNPSDPAWITGSQIKMTTPTVATNENAEFKFSFIAPYNVRSSFSDFKVVLDGAYMLSGNIQKNTTISDLNPSYSQQPGGVHPSLIPLDKGQISNGKLIVKNTSNFVWYNDDARPNQFKGGSVRLVMSWPYYRNSLFANSADPNWLGTSNQIKMLTPIVNPGENAEFDFTWKAPSIAGTYHEHFSLVLDGYLLFTDIGMELVTTVM